MAYVSQGFDSEFDPTFTPPGSTFKMLMMTIVFLLFVIILLVILLFIQGFSFIFSFNKLITSTHCVLGTVLSPGP